MRHPIAVPYLPKYVADSTLTLKKTDIKMAQRSLFSQFGDVFGGAAASGKVIEI